METKYRYKDDFTLYDDWLNLIRSKGGILNSGWNPEKLPGDKLLFNNYEFIKQKMLYEYKLIMEVNRMGRYFMLTKEGERAAEIGMKEYVEELKYKEGLEIDSLKANIKTVNRSYYLSLLAIFAAIIVPVLIEYIDYKKGVPNTKSNPDNTSYHNSINSDSIIERMDSTNFVKIPEHTTH